MELVSREFALKMELSMWAKDAERCVICFEPWTPERIKERGAMVLTISPRRLACAECFVIIEHHLKKSGWRR